jgi:hypothetical protein
LVPTESNGGDPFAHFIIVTGVGHSRNRPASDNHRCRVRQQRLAGRSDIRIDEKEGTWPLKGVAGKRREHKRDPSCSMGRLGEWEIDNDFEEGLACCMVYWSSDLCTHVRTLIGALKKKIFPPAVVRSSEWARTTSAENSAVE